MTAVICVEIPTLPDPLEITLPGGIQIQHLELADVLQPALTPLMPMFQIIDVLTALYTCVTAVMDAIGVPPDPSKLASAIPDLAEKLSKLLGLVPQLSLPLAIVGIVDVLLRVLEDVRGELVHLGREMDAIVAITSRATELNDANLLQIGRCVEENVQQEAANLGKQLASMGRLIGLTNVFLGMIGAPEIPDFSELSGKPIKEAIAPLDVLVDVLRTVRSTIPIP